MASRNYRCPIEAGQVRRFAEASHDVALANQLSDTGSGAVPPTYLGAASTICGQPHGLLDVGFDVARSFHGQERIELLAPVTVGDVLSVQEWSGPVDLVHGRRGGRMRRTVRHGVFRTADGSPVARVERTVLEAERAAPGDPPSHDTSVFDDGIGAAPDALPAAREPCRSSAAVGDDLGRYVFGPLTRTDFVRYAVASGDLTAVHFDEHAARAHGYPAPFAMGMLSAAFAGRALSSWIALAAPWRFTVRFHDQLWPGQSLDVDGRGSGDRIANLVCSAGGRTVTTARWERL